MASVPAPSRWPSASPRKSSSARIAITIAVAEKRPGALALVGTASATHAVGTTIQGVRKSCFLLRQRRQHERSLALAVAAAAGGFEAGLIQDPDVAAPVVDQLLPLQRRGRLRDADPAHAEHGGEKLVRHAEARRMH